MRRDPLSMARWAALASIMMLALALRLCGNTYGLPNHYAPDEGGKVAVAQAWREEPFVHGNSQPSFLYMALFLTDLATDALEPVIRAAHPRADELFPPERAREPILIWMGRILMALISAFTCLIIYRLGREAQSRTAGLAAAWLFAVCPLSVAAATYIKEDTPLTFFVVLGLVLGMRHWRKGSIASAAWAGAAAGAAFAAKYPGALMLAWLMLLIAAKARQRIKISDVAWARRSALAAMAALGGFLAAFVVICPGIALNPAQLFSGLDFQIGYLQSGHHDGIAISAWEYWFGFYLTRGLIPGVGVFVMMAALVGAIVMWRRAPDKTLALLAWGGGYYLLAELMKSKPYPFFHRYVLPVVPVVVVFGGVMIAQILRVRKARQIQPAVRLILPLIILLVCLSPLVSTLRGVAAILPDTRDAARQWLDENAQPGDWLLQTGYGVLWTFPPAMERKALDEAGLNAARNNSGGAAAYVVLSSFAFERYLKHPRKVPGQTEFYSALLNEEEVAARFEKSAGPFGFHNPDIIILRVKQGE